MKIASLASRLSTLLAAGALILAGAAFAAEVRVMTSGAFTAPYKELVPAFEMATGHKVISAYGASQGGAPDSIPSRLDRGEPVDVVILAGPALDGLIKAGKVVDGSRVDVVRSTIGMVVRQGAPKPDISTVEALKRTLLEAKSIAYSASASGTYLSTEMFPKLGIAEQIKGKTQRIVSEQLLVWRTAKPTQWFSPESAMTPHTSCSRFFVIKTLSSETWITARFCPSLALTSFNSF